VFCATVRGRLAKIEALVDGLLEESAATGAPWPSSSREQLRLTADVILEMREDLNGYERTLPREIFRKRAT